MKLTISDGTTAIDVIDDLEPLIEHGPLNVRLDAISTVLGAIRQGVHALTPANASLRETTPARQEQLGQIVAGVAASASALAARAPADDPDALAVMRALRQLHLAD